MPSEDALARLNFEAEVIHWRGPSPYFFAPLPADAAEQVRILSRAVSYGWGMIPVEARIGTTVFRTSLFAKDGAYFLPLKDQVRHAVNATAGDRLAVMMDVRPPRR
jgi:hypothetical protein